MANELNSPNLLQRHRFIKLQLLGSQEEGRILLAQITVYHQENKFIYMEVDMLKMIGDPVRQQLQWSSMSKCESIEIQ